MYELIDVELNMWSCEVSDLTYKQLIGLSLASGENARPTEFGSYFDDETGRFILNKEHPDFEYFVENFCGYLKATAEKREISKKMYGDLPQFRRMAEYLDGILEHMEMSRIKYILNQQIYDPDNWGIIVEAFEGDSLQFIYNYIYNFGVIQGKRRERAKRKRIQEGNA